ncbi:hypothetical protein ASG75_05120 [Rhodanobacter sp. Soil772]|uniref:hypothetical protein n=1 Tax=Rhodanobacter sp. Soil772 TaxID=1736406 RepID=UPI0006F7A225|nr:hypothetical protein [Rhodanobacter sp. Soil772]KRE87506.1 hypothetical protein ASG75_05120 [Rhodanobacter sp. Soil772]
MKFSPKLIAATTALGLCMAAGTVYAQDATPMTPAPAASSMGHMSSGSMQHKMMKHDRNGSMHKMPATVTSADAKTGVVEVTTAGMSLKVHFPPASMAKLKAGDKIVLHMGYSTP